MDIGLTLPIEVVKYVQMAALNVALQPLVVHAVMDSISKIVNATLHA